MRRANPDLRLLMMAMEGHAESIDRARLWRQRGGPPDRVHHNLDQAAWWRRMIALRLATLKPRLEVRHG